MLQIKKVNSTIHTSLLKPLDPSCGSLISYSQEQPRTCRGSYQNLLRLFSAVWTAIHNKIYRKPNANFLSHKNNYGQNESFCDRNSTRGDKQSQELIFMIEIFAIFGSLTFNNNSNTMFFF